MKLVCVLLLLVSCLNKELLIPTDLTRYYTIGTQHFVWVDSNRIDPHYGGFRQINAQLWFPIDSTKSSDLYRQSSYYLGIDSAWRLLNSWSEKDYQKVSLIQTNSLITTKISRKNVSYPLIIFSPGLGGNLSQFSFYAENLAKGGYIVLGVNHLYESQFIIDQSNRVQLGNFSFHDSLKSLSIPDQISADDYRMAKGPRQKILAEDLIFALNKVSKLNKSLLNNRLNLNQVGTFGHSIGGAAVIYASLLDERFKAVINIDGTPPTIALKRGINVPFLFIEDLTDYRNHSGYKLQFDRRHDFCKKNRADSYRILFSGTNHNSFSDFVYNTTYDYDEKKEIYGVLNKTLNFSKDFFDMYLKGKRPQYFYQQVDSIEMHTFIK